MGDDYVTGGEAAPLPPATPEAPMRYMLLWLLGIPIPILLLLWIFKAV